MQLLFSEGKAVHLEQMNQFDPEQQFAALLNETDEHIEAVLKDFERLRWLRERIAERFADLQAKADAIEVYTEKELAAHFDIKPELLATLRRAHNLPHCSFGNKIRYTRRDADAILEILSTRNAQKPAKLAA